MARPKGPEQRVPVKMRVNIGLMDRLRQLAAENRYSVPKMLTVIMEETLADLPADYELHEMAEIYTLTKNHAVNLSSNRMNVYLLPGTQEAMLELARRLNASIGWIIWICGDCCEVNYGSELPGEHLNRALSGSSFPSSRCFPAPLYLHGNTRGRSQQLRK